MNAEERQLISDLFERLRNVGQIDKDRDAEALIISCARQNPDAGYLLVQNVLVQEHLVQQQQQELQNMQARIQELESMVARGQPAARTQPAGNGGFLGGMFGGGARQAAPAPQSVPVSRQQPTYSQPQSSSPWGRSAAPQQGGYQQPPAYQPPQQAPAAGGGFMRSAMGMAAGVAGGMLAANAISNMMKGNTPSGESPAQASGGDLGSNDPGVSDTYNSSGDAGANYGSEPINDYNNDPGTYSEANDSGDAGGESEY
jgi:uncharacterized protein